MSIYNRLINLKKSTFIKHSLTMLIGTVIAQLLIVVSSPLITRLYTAEEFGVFTIFLTICSTLFPIINLRYDLLIVKAKNINETNHLTTISLIIGFFFVLLYSLGAILIDTLELFDLSIDIAFIYLVIPFLIIGSVVNVFSSYNNRLTQYKLLSKVSIVRSFFQVSSQIIFGLLKFGSLALSISYVLSFFMGTVIQYKAFMKQYKVSKSYRELIKTFKENINQLYFSTPSILINSLSYSLIIFFIGYLYTPYEVGLYALTLRLLGMPLSIISLSVSKVFFERASKEYLNKGSFRDIYVKTSLALLAISLPIFGLMYLLNAGIFELVFGVGWGQASDLLKVLIPMYSIRLVVSTVSIGILLVDKQKYELVLQISFIFSSIASFIVVKLLDKDFMFYLNLINISFTISYLVFYIVLLNLSGKKGNTLKKYN